MSARVAPHAAITLALVAGSKERHLHTIMHYMQDKYPYTLVTIDTTLLQVRLNIQFNKLMYITY